MCCHTHSQSPLALSRRRILSGLGVVSLACALPLGASTLAQDTSPFGTPMPEDRDSCPVCGMFPARYSDWIATILYKDGQAVHFDGAKDMFKYLLDMEKYAAGKKRDEIQLIGVTDYYATARIDATKALYVIGSDVLGPMGHDLIPHPDTYDAKEFMKDHLGKRLLGFDDVNMELLLALDKGEFVVK